MSTILTYLSLGVLVGFVIDDFSVDESVGMIEFCLSVSGPSAVRIDLIVSVEPGTAQCEF